MADIRPAGSGLPQPPHQGRPANPARTAAQRAFFNAALGQAAAAAPVRPQQAAAPAPAAAAPVKLAATAAEEPPQRYLRPGSLLDIKV